ncbi:hypothetical protein ZWY2020_035752, partial [Hordeum vulgare]
SKHEARVVEIQHDLQEASSKCQALEQKSQEQVTELSKLSAKLKSERVDQRFFQEEVRQAKLIENGAFTDLPWSVAEVAKHYAAHDGDVERRLFWAQFQTLESNPSLSYEMKQLMELHRMAEPTMQDLCVRLWPTEPLPRSYFSLVQKLVNSVPRIKVVKRTVCIEGARMAFARTMMHWPGVKPLMMATTPPPAGKEHRRPELYFSSATEGARVIEAQCSKDVIFE